MENPSTWGEAEHVVNKVLDRYFTDANTMFCGLSLERQITDALREAGLLHNDTGKQDKHAE